MSLSIAMRPKIAYTLSQNYSATMNKKEEEEMNSKMLFLCVFIHRDNRMEWYDDECLEETSH